MLNSNNTQAIQYDQGGTDFLYKEMIQLDNIKPVFVITHW